MRTREDYNSVKPSDSRKQFESAQSMSCAQAAQARRAIFGVMRQADGGGAKTFGDFVHR
jgi:hypothetical protein